MAADEKRDAGRGNKDDSVKKQEDHEEQTTHRHHRTQILINDSNQEPSKKCPGRHFFKRGYSSGLGLFIPGTGKIWQECQKLFMKISQI
jgi:hypothetical protein